MKKYEIVFAHAGDTNTSVLGRADTIKEAKKIIADCKKVDSGHTIWTEGRRGYIGLVGGKVVFHVRIECGGIIR